MSQKVLGPGLFLFLLGTHHANPTARSLPYISVPPPPKQHKALESQGHLINHLVSPSAQSSHSALSPHGSTWSCWWGACQCSHRACSLGPVSQRVQQRISTVGTWAQKLGAPVGDSTGPAVWGIGPAALIETGVQGLSGHCYQDPPSPHSSCPFVWAKNWEDSEQALTAGWASGEPAGPQETETHQSQPGSAMASAPLSSSALSTTPRGCWAEWCHLCDWGNAQVCQSPGGNAPVRMCGW